MSKNAIITGGTRGLGEAMTLKLGDLGYNVAINYTSERSGALADALVKRLKEEKGVDAIAVKADVSDYPSCENLVKTALDHFNGQLDVLINNAGITNNCNFIDLQPKDYMRVINTNLVSMMHMSHLCLPYLVDHDSCIVNTASVGGLVGVVNQADYCAAKTGVIGLTRALALEFAPRKVRVNAIAPGMIMTDMLRGVNQDELKALAATIPLGYIGEPSDIAGCMEYILTAPYLTGQTISPNGGFVMP